MDDHQLPVRAQMHIQLDALGPLLHGKAEGLQRIFGRVLTGTPVSKYFGLFHGFILSFFVHSSQNHRLSRWLE